MTFLPLKYDLLWPNMTFSENIWLYMTSYFGFPKNMTFYDLLWLCRHPGHVFKDEYITKNERHTMKRKASLQPIKPSHFGSEFFEDWMYKTFGVVQRTM